MKRPALFPLAAAAALLMGAACAPTAPTPVPPTPVTNGGVTCTAGANSTVNCGNVNTAPSPSASPSATDNVVKSLLVTCYGFGAQPGQAEPNHGLCALPPGYPEIAITASPKNAAGVDIPRPGDQSDPAIIDWAFEVVPAGAASLVVNSQNRFNARVVPASPRVGGAVFTATATYHDPQGNEWKTSKSGSIQ